MSDYYRHKYTALREAVKKFLIADGNDMCHENRVELAAAIGAEAKRVKPLPFFRFMWNCLKYRIGLSRQGCRNCQAQGSVQCPSNSRT